MGKYSLQDTKDSTIARLIDLALDELESDTTLDGGAPEDRVIPVVTDHVLVRRIGRGSYGEVWLARNIMGEYRAVKIVHQGDFDGDKPFERELEGIRKFEPISRRHESQLDILHVGRADGFFYYVMELADDAGGNEKIDPVSYEPLTLRQLIKAKGCRPVEEVVEIGCHLAEALSHLHGHGLVHRDIKLSNIVFINGRPKLADIGLVTDQDATLSMVGTEGYLPPEGPGSTRADVYSLGRVLYETVTGQDRREYPAWPEELNVDEALELKSVIERACEPAFNRRYQDGKALLGDLKLLEKHESIRDRRRLERNVRVFRKLGVAATVVVALALGAFGYQRSQTREKQRLAAVAEQESQNSRESLLALYEANSVRLSEEGRNAEALHWTERALRIADAESEEKSSLAQSADWLRRSIPTLFGFNHSPNPNNKANWLGGPSPVRGRLLVPKWDGPGVEDLYTGEVLFELGDGDLKNSGALYSRDGRYIITESRESPRLVRIWDALDGKPISPWLAHSNRVTQIEISSDGMLAATFEESQNEFLSETQKVHIWNLRSGQEVFPAIEFNEDATPSRILFDLKNEQLLIGVAKILSPSKGENQPRYEGQVWKLDPHSGDVRVTGIRQDAWINDMELSPDGEQLLTSSIANWGAHPYSTLWDLTSERPLHRFHHSVADRTALDFRATFSPDGSRIASWNAGVIRVWDARNGNKLLDDIELDAAVQSVSISPDNQTLAAGASDNRLYLWNIYTGNPIDQPIPHNASVNLIQFSHDSRFVHTVTDNAWMRVWDLGSTTRDVTVLKDSAPVKDARFTPDGTRVITRTDGNALDVWEADSGILLRTLESDHPTRSFAIDPQGRYVAVLTNPGTVHLWDLHDPSFQPSPITPDTDLLQGLEFSSDGKQLAVFGDGITLLDLGNEIRVARTFLLDPEWKSYGPIPVVDVAFSPDGRLLVGARSREIWTWDLETGELLSEVRPVWINHTNLPDFTRDGEKLFFIDRMRARFVKTAALREGDALQESDFTTMFHRDPLNDAELSEDEQTVVLGSVSGKIYVHDADTGRLRFPALRHGFQVSSVAMTPGGETVISAARDGTLRFWSAKDGAMIGPVVQYRSAISRIEVSPDGRQLLAVDRQGAAWLRRLDNETLNEDQLARWARLHTGSELDDRGVFTAAKLTQLLEDHQHFVESLPAKFHISNEERLRWHKNRLKETDLPQLLATPLFHLDQMLALGEDNDDLRERRRNLVARAYPERAPETPAGLIDMTAFYNDDFRQSNPMLVEFHWKELPIGVQEFEGIPFDLRGRIFFRGENLSRSDRGYPLEYPERMNGIPVGVKTGRLHFLHNATYGDTRFPVIPHKIGEYVVHYVDGTSIKIPLIYGENLYQDFVPAAHTVKFIESESTKVAWEATKSVGWDETRPRLYMMRWDNPHPDLEIASLDVVNLPSKESFALFAITVE